MALVSITLTVKINNEGQLEVIEEGLIGRRYDVVDWMSERDRTTNEVEVENLGPVEEGEG